MSTQTGVSEYLALSTDNKSLHEYLAQSESARILTLLSGNPELDEQLYLSILPKLKPEVAVRRANRPLTDEMVRALYSSGSPLVRQALLDISASSGYISEVAFRYLLQEDWMSGYLRAYILYELKLPENLKAVAVATISESDHLNVAYVASRGSRQSKSLEIQRLNRPTPKSDRYRPTELSVALAATVNTPDGISMGGAARAVTSYLGERSAEFWRLFVELGESWAGTYQELINSTLALSETPAL